MKCIWHKFRWELFW